MDGISRTLLIAHAREELYPTSRWLKGKKQPSLCVPVREQSYSAFFPDLSTKYVPRSACSSLAFRGTRQQQFLHNTVLCIEMSLPLCFAALWGRIVKFYDEIAPIWLSLVFVSDGHALARHRQGLPVSQKGGLQGQRSTPFFSV